MIIAIASIYIALVYIAFRVIKIPIRPVTVSVAIIIGVVIIGGIVIGWQGGAPVSQQLTLSRYVLQIVPDVKGIIKKNRIETNQLIKKGDVMFEIDPAPFQYVVNQYEAQLSSARAQVEKQKATVKLAAATVARSRADAAVAKAKRDAQVELQSRGSAAVRELRVFELRREYEAAEAAVNEALASEEQAKSALVAAEKNVGNIESLLKGAKFELEATVYRAPADGRVLSWQAREGTMTTRVTSRWLGTMMDTSDSRVIAVFPMSLLRNVAAGDAVEVAFKSSPGQIHRGKVNRVIKWTAEGQFVVGGVLPEIASLGSKGHLAAVIRLDDKNFANKLALGEAGAAAIYTRPTGPFHAISKIYLRMLSLTFYLPF